MFQAPVNSREKTLAVGTVIRPWRFRCPVLRASAGPGNGSDGDPFNPKKLQKKNVPLLWSVGE